MEILNKILEILPGYSNCETKYKLLSNKVETKLTSDISEIIKIIEQTMNIKFYSKEHILTHCDSPTKITEQLIENLIIEIPFNDIFKKMHLSLVFMNDEIIILYKNKKINMLYFDKIIENIYIENPFLFPEIPDLYSNNIHSIIKKFINKDITVKYNCTNIPKPYWILFEIKCKKNNLKYNIDLESSKKYDQIISGQKYFIQPTILTQNNITHTLSSIDSDTDPELKIILQQINELENKTKTNQLSQPSKIDQKILTSKEQKDLDDHHRMEVMSYLNDTEVMQFLDKLEFIDKIDYLNKDKEYYCSIVKQILDMFTYFKNQMIKYYLYIILFKYINNNESFIEENPEFLYSIKNKSIELSYDLHTIITAGLSISNEISKIFNQTVEIINKIGKKIDPLFDTNWLLYDPTKSKPKKKIVQVSNSDSDSDSDLDSDSDDD